MKKIVLTSAALSLVAAPVFAQVDRATAPVDSESELASAPGAAVLIGALAVALGVILIAGDDDDEPASP